MYSKMAPTMINVFRRGLIKRTILELEDDHECMWHQNMQVVLECASNIRMRSASVSYDNEKVTKLDMHDVSSHDEFYVTRSGTT